MDLHRAVFEQFERRKGVYIAIRILEMPAGQVEFAVAGIFDDNHLGVKRPSAAHAEDLNRAPLDRADRRRIG